MYHRIALLAAAGVVAIAVSGTQPAQAIVAGGPAAQANTAAQAEISDVTEIRKRRHHRRHHHHRHHRHHNDFWWWGFPYYYR